MNKAQAAKKAIQSAGGRLVLAKSLAAEFGIPLDRMYWRVSQWRRNGVAPQFVIPVEKRSGVSRHDLCPKIYPREAA